MTDCIILGAGIIGMSCARALHKRGVNVTLLDIGEAGKQSSWAGGGILSPLHPWHYEPAVSELVQYSLQHYPEYIDELQQETGIDPEYIRSGALFVDEDSIRRGQAWADSRQHPYELLDAAQICEYAPALKDTHAQGILFPDIYQLRTPRLLNALRVSLVQSGIPLHENMTGLRLNIAAGGVQGVQTAAGSMSAGKVIVAAGAWSAAFLQQQYLAAPPIQPIRGQMILYKTAPHTLDSLLLDERYYLIPRQDGRILAGSTTEMTGFDAATTDAAKQELEQAAHKLMPLLQHHAVEHHWAGLRPGSENGIPSICSHPDVNGLYINAGHFRNGVAMAPGSAELMADLIFEKTPALPSQAYKTVAAGDKA